MLDCLILGDSIAVGTHQAKPECSSLSVGGLNTWQWNRRFKDRNLQAKQVIISLGTNDHSGVNTFRELSNLRQRVSAQQVTWILPPCNPKFCKPHIVEVVEILANSWNDQIISTTKLQGDGIHPSWQGYRELARKIN